MPRIVAILCLCLMATNSVPAQTPGVEANYRDMAGQSSVIVIGTVERGGWIIRPDRLTNKTTMLPNGQRITELQNPSEYVVGRIVRLRVSEVLKGGARVKVNSTISVFESGHFPAEGSAILAERQKYVVFLAPLKPGGDEFAGTVVQQPGAHPGGEPPFVPNSYYVVVGGAAGTVQITPANSRVVNQIRSVVRRTRS
jgi:hypothetical protein